MAQLCKEASGICTADQQSPVRSSLKLCSKNTVYIYSKYDSQEKKNSPEEGDEELHQVHDAVVLREGNLGKRTEQRRNS